MNFKIRTIRQHAQITSSNSELKNTITHKGLQCLMMDRFIAVARPKAQGGTLDFKRRG